MTTQLVLALGVAIVLGLVGVWDAWAVFTEQGHLTVSDVVSAWAHRWPVIAFLAGMLADHLFGR